jgi:hypothetical protein
VMPLIVKGSNNFLNSIASPSLDLIWPARERNTLS